ncbi:MAG: ABC transporter substrate-binding protein, partial [Clostridia bacterium]|nr:ABC transporter substrate-binding protein [Clostridia bacterium]
MLKRSLSANKIISILVLFTVCLFVVYGCSENNEKGNKDEGVTFTDALGRNVTVKHNPERTAALLGSFADVWALSGGKVCATAQEAWEDFDLDLEDAVNLGGAHSPSLEALIASNPDFVLASASTSSNVEMKETLENSGITVAYFDVDNFNDYLDMLKICTDITGRNDLYEQNGLEVQSKTEKIKEEFKNAEIPEKERTVLMIRTSSSSVKAKGSEGTVLGEMLADLGCIN